MRSFAVLLVFSVLGGMLFMLLGDNESPGPDGREVSASRAELPQIPQVYYAIGDSITFGEEVGFAVDESGYPIKSDTRFLGWPGLLGYLLTRGTGTSTLVLNWGHPGDRTATIRKQRLLDLPRTDAGESSALLLLGTNDSNDFNTTPSGEDCAMADCTGTFKEELLEIIAELQDRGYDPVHVATIPPIWGSTADALYRDPLADTATRNRRVLEYNRVIQSAILTEPGVLPGPDLFSCFLASGVNRFSLFEDHMHPNTLGYVMLAELWRDAIVTGRSDFVGTSCLPPVYILASLDPYTHGHKQNLLEAGDRYYTDEEYVLLNVPRELANGIWVLQANSDRDNADAVFLEFDAGESPVSVYIAYDPAGPPPVSSSHEFSARELSSKLSVSDASVNAFEIVVAANVTGKVSIGGNKSAAGPGAQQAYVVIVTP